MDSAHCGVREVSIPLLPVAHDLCPLQLIVELLHIVARDGAQLLAAEARQDMVFNHAAVAADGAGAQGRLPGRIRGRADRTV